MTAMNYFLLFGARGKGEKMNIAEKVKKRNHPGTIYFARLT